MDVPVLFRVILHVSDIDQASDFYAALLKTEGRRIHGARHYFDCGPVILAVVDPTSAGETLKPNADYFYFAVQEIEKIHQRASELGCLSPNQVHGESAGEIITRPWGERSFYAYDPFGNGLCFVDQSTIFTGRR